MFARGLSSLHTPPLLDLKSLKVKSRVSTTSKLIQTKRLQVLYSGHLRKTGGRGSYRLVQPAGWTRESWEILAVVAWWEYIIRVLTL
jgi:hypothetical protein